MNEACYNNMSGIKWGGTVLCLIGIAFTSFNVYPLNILFGLVGSGLWTYAGILQRDLPLILVEIVAVVLYFAGVVTYINVRL
jgi:ABC-type microcin C transport system permease subunit YejB